MGKLDDVMGRIKAHKNASNKPSDSGSLPFADDRSFKDSVTKPAKRKIKIHPSESSLATTGYDAEKTVEAEIFKEKQHSSETPPSSEQRPSVQRQSEMVPDVQVTEHADLSLVVKTVSRFNWHPNVQVCQTQTNAAEELKKLRTNLINLVDRHGFKSFMITSCKHAEGKTTTALALARSFAGLGNRRVCLIDGDMRRPRVKNFLDLAVDVGLDDVVFGEADLADALVHSEQDNLTVLPTRKGRSIASELLGSNRMKAVIRDLSQNFDILIFDSPPCLSTTDPIILGGLVDGVSLAVKMNHTPRQSVEHSIALMRQSEVPFIGLILTHHVVHYNTYLLQRYNYYQDYYGYYSNPDGEP